MIDQKPPLVDAESSLIFKEDPYLCMTCITPSRSRLESLSLILSKQEQLGIRGKLECKHQKPEMEMRKVLPGPVRLACLVIVSLFCLIHNSQGFSSGLERTVEEIEDKVPNPVMAGNSLNSSSGDSEARSRFFSRRMFRKKRRSSSAPTTSTVPSNIILSDRIDDLEYSFDNETLVEKRNKTVSLGDKVDPPIEEEDNFCPGLIGSMRSVLQSTLPAYEMILFAIVNVVFFVVFLFLWKNVYYERDDPYATVSPYGFGPGPSTPAPKARSSDQLDEIMRTVQKSIQR
ncbi:unnamed protein product [Allacma fusca]|uniref:Uncharacterized protein n=1 Tax=Allacma fusca TaxID=39272 RepID=A0A8J2KDM7_9HEXA|nr:unnamed protein product [Allacma fusca]